MGNKLNRNERLMNEGMLHSYYGHKMFLTDIIISTFWAFFAITGTPEFEDWMIWVVISRIIMCFMMKAKSTWIGYSSLVFGAVYWIIPSQYSGGFFKAPAEMMTFAVNLLDLELPKRNFHCCDSVGYQICYCILCILFTVWIVGMPLYITIRRKNHRLLPKWSWIPVTITSLLIIIRYILSFKWPRYEFLAAWILIASYYPIICWVVKHGKTESVISVLLECKPFVYYCGFVLVFISSYIIGLKTIYSLMPVALALIPVAYYALISKSNSVNYIPTPSVILMVTCGMCFWYSMQSGTVLTIILLVCANISLLIVAINLIRKNGNWFASICLIIGTSVLCPCVLGLNPYSVTASVHTRLYTRIPNIDHVLFVTTNGNGRYGIRDRYRELVSMDNFQIEPISKNDEIILRCEKVVSENNSIVRNAHYSYYSLQKHRFLTYQEIYMIIYFPIIDRHNNM